MSAPALLAEAETAGLTPRAVDGRLHWRADAPPQPDLLAQLRWQKAELLEILAEIDESAGILDGGVPRQQAEAQAVAEVLARAETGAA